jgi:ferredoxin
MSQNGQDEFISNPSSKVKIKIIKASCISAAICIIRAPNTFDLDENGIAYVKEGTWDDAVDILEAAKACPTLAVFIEDMEGNQLWPKK